MTLTEILKQVEKFTVDNSPSILTIIGVSGTITTAVLSAKAGIKAARLIDDEDAKRALYETYSPLDPKEKAQLVWKVYLPPAGAAVLTISAVIGANRIGNRRAAAVAAAYSLSEKAFAEYKEKVVEKLGTAKEQAARDELAQERVDKNPVSKSEVVIAAGGEVLCYEAFTGRYFKSDMETLKKAQNDLNYKILNNFYASLTDFYNLIGLSPTTYSDEVGWNSDKLLELEFSTVLSEDSKPCIAINFAVAPIRDYYRIH